MYKDMQIITSWDAYCGDFNLCYNYHDRARQNSVIKQVTGPQNCLHR